MKSCRSTALILLALCWPGVSAAMDGDDAPRLPVGRGGAGLPLAEYRALIRVEMPLSGPPEAEVVQAWAQAALQTAVRPAGPAPVVSPEGVRVAELSAEDAARVVRGDFRAYFELQVQLRLPSGEAFWRGVVSRTEEFMTVEAQRLDEQARERVVAEREQAGEERRDAERIVSGLQARLARLQSRELLRAEGLAAQLHALHGQRFALELELHGLEHRLRAIEHHLERARERAADDEQAARQLVENLAEVVQLREQQLARAEQLHEAGAATPAELTRQREELLLARVQRDLAALQRRGNEPLERLQQELTDTMIARVVAEGRLAFAGQRLQELETEFTAEPLAEQRRALETELDAAQQALRQAETKFRELDRRLATAAAVQIARAASPR